MISITGRVAASGTHENLGLLDVRRGAPCKSKITKFGEQHQTAALEEIATGLDIKHLKNRMVKKATAASTGHARNTGRSNKAASTSLICFDVVS